MDFVGLVMVLAGIYLLDSLVKNRKPVETLKMILAHPESVQAILESQKNTGATVPRIISADGSMGSMGGETGAPTGDWDSTTKTGTSTSKTTGTKTVASKTTTTSSAGKNVPTGTRVPKGGGTAGVVKGGGQLLPNAQGWVNVNSSFLDAVRRWAADTGRTFKVTPIGAWRDYATQKRAYDNYLKGGTKAANPDKPATAPHMRGEALDVSPHPNANDIQLMKRYGLGLTVRGEPWHIGMT